MNERSTPSSNLSADVKFSIVTPSFRNSDWLKLCIASVADQQGVQFEHLVQDAGSDDGTLDWLPHDSRVKAFVERDAGMYDAVNRGWKRCTGDVLAYLNCDEQYLPGALQAIEEFFNTHPEVDVALPDVVVVRKDGSYLCHRYSMVPQRQLLWLRFSVTTSSLFIRRRVIERYDLWFDTQWRALGDFHWVRAAVDRGVRFAEVRFFASVFTETGENLALTLGGRRESALKAEMTPRWVRAAGALLLAWHRWRYLWRILRYQRPFAYSLYTLDCPERRVTHQVERPTARWVRAPLKSAAVPATP